MLKILKNILTNSPENYIALLVCNPYYMLFVPLKLMSVTGSNWDRFCQMSGIKTMLTLSSVYAVSSETVTFNSAAIALGGTVQLHQDIVTNRSSNGDVICGQPSNLWDFCYLLKCTIATVKNIDQCITTASATLV